MKKLLFGFALLVLISAHAQNISGVVKVQAFMREQFAGTIAVDDNGNPLTRGVDTTYMIYIETKGAVPLNMRAWKNGIQYKVTPVAMKGSIAVGERQIDEKKQVLKAGSGNQLWLLQLDQVNETRKAPAIKNSSNDTWILEGMGNKKSFVYPIREVVVMRSIPAV